MKVLKFILCMKDYHKKKIKLKSNRKGILEQKEYKL